MSDDFSNHQRSWIGLFIVLGIALLLCLCVFALLARGQQGVSHLEAEAHSEPSVSAALPSTEVTETSPEPTQPESPVTRLTVTLPPDYTPLFHYPVIFEYATGKSPFPAMRPNQAILAIYQPDFANPLTARLAETEAITLLTTLSDKYSIDMEQIYLFTAGIDGLDFATRHASHFCGVLLQLPEDLAADSWDTLPLANLNNLPVALDISRNPHPDSAVQALSTSLAAVTGRSPYAPQRLIMPVTSPLPQLLAHLTQDAPQDHNHIVWQTDSLAAGEAWWLRTEEISIPGEPASFVAEYHPGKAPAVAQITITTQNLNAFAIRRTWKDFSKVRTFLLTVDGQNMDLPLQPNSPEWCVIRKQDNGWQTTPSSPDRPRKSPTCDGPLFRTFQEPHVIVWGTSDPDTAPLWEKCANALAQRMEELTQQPEVVLPDKDFTSQNAIGKHLVLLGSPRENLLTNGLLDTHPDFLRQIYQKDSKASGKFDSDDEEENPLCCATLYPADFYVPGRLALLVLADIPEYIEDVWRPLVSPQALQGDYLLFQPGETTPRAIGWCTSDWEIGE